MSLYRGWLETVQANRSKVAIRELASGEVWRFGDLEARLGEVPRGRAGAVREVSLAAGMVAFVVETLAVWRDGGVLLPLEVGGVIPEVAGKELADGIVHLKVTSGSTGRPQVMGFTAGQLEADLEAIEGTMGLCVEEPNLGLVSAAHSYGFSNLILPLLLRGMPLWQAGDPLPGSIRRAWAVARAEGVTLTVPAVPAMWRAWAKADLLTGVPVRLAISAGAPLPLDVERQIFSTAGLKVHTFYGSSECGGIAFDDSDEPRGSVDVVGRPLRGVGVSVNEEGCLVVRSRAVSAGYVGADPAQRRRLGEGCFQTTDCATLEGRLIRLTGRLTECINVAGRKISPMEIESVLLRHRVVTHCLVFGVPSHDSSRVEDIVACVNVESPQAVAALKVELGRELPAWQQPRIWWETSALRPDSRGKMSRAQWRQRFLREQAGDRLVTT